MVRHKQIKIEYTSMALRGSDWKEKIQEGLNACHEHGFEFGIQIHNSDTYENFQKIAELGIQLSFHAPILSKFQINLASKDPNPSMNAIDETAKLMKKYDVEKAVFHAFNMTDEPIPSFGRGRGYEDAFAASNRPELCLNENSSICKNFFATDEYIKRNKRVSERLSLIREKYPNFSFLLENDFPRYGAGSIFAEHIVWMRNPICLDSSHLWASSFIFDRDFRTEIENFLRSGLVEMLHLHASKFTPKIPKEKWSDGHLPLDTPNQMNLPEIIKLCYKYSVKNFVLEINDVSKKDIDFIAKTLNTAI